MIECLILPHDHGKDGDVMKWKRYVNLLEPAEISHTETLHDSCLHLLVA